MLEVHSGWIVWTADETAAWVEASLISSDVLVLKRHNDFGHLHFAIDHIPSLSLLPNRKSAILTVILTLTLSSQIYPRTQCLVLGICSGLKWRESLIEDHRLGLICSVPCYLAIASYCVKPLPSPLSRWFSIHILSLVIIAPCPNVHYIHCCCHSVFLLFLFTFHAVYKCTNCYNYVIY